MVSCMLGAVLMSAVATVANTCPCARLCPWHQASTQPYHVHTPDHPATAPVEHIVEQVSSATDSAHYRKC